MYIKMFLNICFIYSRKEEVIIITIITVSFHIKRQYFSRQYFSGLVPSVITEIDVSVKDTKVLIP